MLFIKKITGFRIALIFLILLTISYRDFLTNIKLMLFHFYNFPMLPLDPYYKIILLLDGKTIGLSDHQIDGGWSWWVLRIIPHIINWTFFKIIPCLQMNVIPEFVSREVYCSIWSISLVNYFSGILSQICFFLILKLKFRRPSGECILILFSSYFVINFLDRYGIDRISFLFLMVFFLSEKKEKITYFLIFLSILVNEKCTLLICSYYFLKNFNLKKPQLSFLNLKFIYSFLLCLLYFIYSFIEIKQYFGLNIVTYNYLTMHAVSNSLIPLTLIVYPFYFYFNKKKILNIFNIKKIYFIIILLFFILSIFVGGSGNMGRYLTYTAVLFWPLGNFFIYKILSNINYLYLSPKYSKIDIIKTLTKH